MAAMESTEDWLRRIGSEAARKERVELRLAGALNAPIRSRGGINTLGKPHSLYCKCDVCVPPWLKEEMKSWPVVTKGMYEARREASPKPKRKRKSER